MRTATALVILLAFACLLPQPARATSVCATMPAPTVVVRTAEKPARFDMKQSMEQLSALKQQGGHGAPHPLHASVGGLMEGMVSLDHKIGYNVKTDQKTGLSCIQFTHVIVNLWLEPKVYVASDLTGQSCWYREVFAHEAKHVAADRELMKRYQFFFTEGLNLMFLDPADYASGAVPQAALEREVAAMNATVEEALGVLFNGMMRERSQIHQAIDSPHEYHRVSSRC